MNDLPAVVENTKTSLLENLEQIGEEFAELKKQTIARIKEVFEPAFQEFFKKYPLVTAITWTQYTPYFNDGEPCEFGVHEKYFTTDKNPDLESRHPEDSEDGNWYGGYLTPHDPEIYRERQRKNGCDYSDEIARAEAFHGNLANAWVAGAERDLDRFSSIPDEVYQSLGEGKVIVTPNGISVEEYDHD